MLNSICLTIATVHIRRAISSCARSACISQVNNSDSPTWDHRGKSKNVHAKDGFV